MICRSFQNTDSKINPCKDLILAKILWGTYMSKLHSRNLTLQKLMLNKSSAFLFTTSMFAFAANRYSRCISFGGLQRNLNCDLSCRINCFFLSKVRVVPGHFSSVFYVSAWPLQLNFGSLLTVQPLQGSSRKSMYFRGCLHHKYLIVGREKNQYHFSSFSSFLQLCTMTRHICTNIQA